MATFLRHKVTYFVHHLFTGREGPGPGDYNPMATDVCCYLYAQLHPTMSECYRAVCKFMFYAYYIQASQKQSDGQGGQSTPGYVSQ